MKLRRSAMATCLTCALLMPGSAWGQTPAHSEASGGFVKLEVKGPLNEETKAILKQLVEPRSTPKLIDTVAKTGAPVSTICGPQRLDMRCSNLDPAIATANQDASSAIGSSNFGARKIVEAPMWGPPALDAFKSKEYIVFASQDPIVQAAGKVTPDHVPIVVPKAALDAAGFALGGLPVSGLEAVTAVEGDLRVSEASGRNFRINRRLSQDRLNELIASLNAQAGSTISATRVAIPKNTFSLIQFQNTGASCTSADVHWPFDAMRVKTIMEFNVQVRQRMNLGRARRSRILVVDTGLGKTLAQTQAFNKLLYADVAEMLTPASLQRDFGQPRCTDANENGYWRDVYGTGSGVAASDDTRCLSSATTALDLIDPHPKSPTSQQIYNPDHGSFVAGLAVGGPRFVAAFPTLSDYIGLTLFRIPQRSDVPELSIVNEFADIAKSIDYAGKIEADVINMSLKTDRDEPFRAILSNPVALLVAAAGNGSEDLDNHPSENFPASLGMTDRLIVVAALEAGSGTSFWPNSAFSSTRVHIAAPGAAITSFNAKGEEVCDSGTSAAAPLVSFVAATIKSLTGATRPIVRARLLAAADRVQSLSGKVEDGRRLNVEAALDLFVDRVELKTGPKKLLRGWIEPDRTDALVRVCHEAGGSLDHSRGQVDLSVLWDWYRRPDDGVSLRYNRSTSETFASGQCQALTTSFKFFDLEGGRTVDVDWTNVQKVLPTPFRSVKRYVVNAQ